MQRKSIHTKVASSKKAYIKQYLIAKEHTKFQSFKVDFNNVPEGHRPMWIYTMYAGMSTGKYNDK